MALLHQLKDLATNPRHNKWLCPSLLLADTALTIAIVLKIPYTEIDWTTYMQQIKVFLAGERDYKLIAGDTGPLVYPAVHVYIYRILYAVTSSGKDIVVAQGVFSLLYLGTLGLVMLCYRKAGVPPYVFPLLVLSKRLHSVFVLRLFNDCWAVLFLWMAIFCWQRGMWTLGSFAYSLGVGVKMSLLLVLPAVGMVFWHALGRERGFRQASMLAQIQVLAAFQFLAAAPQSYLTRAFEFSRQFLFKWTVNWRFVGEPIFLSQSFSLRLMASHILTLVIFTSTRWLRPSKASIFDAINQLFDPPPPSVQAMIAKKITPKWIMTTILSAMIIGCLFARSLHYQFYAYIAWSTPFLLWSAGLHPILIYAVWAAQEWAWNIYPSTDESSLTVVGSLAFTVLSVWVGTRNEEPEEEGDGVPAAASERPKTS